MIASGGATAATVDTDHTRRGKNGKVPRSLGFARSDEDLANKRFERTARTRRTSLALAMLKVVGSSPIIRSPESPKTGLFRLRRDPITLNRFRSSIAAAVAVAATLASESFASAPP